MDFFSRMNRTEAGREPVDLSQVRADDAFIDSLVTDSLPNDNTGTAPLFDGVDDRSVEERFADPRTAGVPASSDGGQQFRLPTQRVSSDARLTELLQSWRHEIIDPPLPAPIDAEVAVTIVRNSPARKRSIRPMIAVAAAIAGLLLGSAAIGARSATPDSVLWPVTQLLWGDRADSVLAGIDARQGINRAREALQADHPEAALTALDHVTSVITRVSDRDGRETLESDYQSVMSDLETATQDGAISTSTSAPSTNTAVGPTTGTPPVVIPTLPTGSTSVDTTTSEEPTSSSDQTSDPSTSEETSSDDTTTSDDTSTSDESSTDTSTSESTDTSTSTETSVETVPGDPVDPAPVDVLPNEPAGNEAHSVSADTTP